MSNGPYTEISDPDQARFVDLLVELCEQIDIIDVNSVLQRRQLVYQGFDVIIDHVLNDPQALYMQFDYGMTTAGRTLTIFRLMLESNLLVYAQDQAQLGLDPDSGNSHLIVRLPMTDDIDGAWLADTLRHYAEHGRYWREHLLQAPDELYEAISSGNYLWLRG
ncbi:CesT family type III secretion system chaperone [Paucibacter sp. PLA-PC-4]|uniref:CesT family type III secretion system chaperone n=1 Tax=Paucibacter sp. PLA-PC-4 TaxID=2993655 RepID=UPI00224AEEC7|nr:CesT family type III secretion system chaperone [Paucibacter sp. PLA-PC-4]MCX2865574.1 CesT family type III secretion system chaperone [Paucibacter sp. PLA-PC-4]